MTPNLIAPPPPPTITQRSVAFFDTECYPNFWLLKISTRAGQMYTFALRDGCTFDAATISRIRLIFDTHCMVSFNGDGYDVPMITAALHGATPAQLKAINDRIIVDQMKPWELGLPDWQPADHLDIMEVAPGAGSQKQYAGRIHSKTMRDLPYDPSRNLTDAEMAEVDSYCGNDLAVLAELFDALKSQIDLRVKLSARYGMDLRSKSDAQIAEAVLRRRCEIATGRKIYKPEVDWDMRFKYRVPSFIAFHDPRLRQMLEVVGRVEFSLSAAGRVEMPSELSDVEIRLGGSVYRMGIGGLHSQEKQLAAVSNATHQIRMPDVASYYPSLMVNAGAWPAALGQTFVTEFTTIMRERLAAKAAQARMEDAGDTSSPEYLAAVAANEGGKIQINGTFGKTGSPYSVLFAPEMMIQTTLTGQLALLMLIEWHEQASVPVISANTDGIVINCPRDKLAISEMLIAEWQRVTGLTMETHDYAAIYARDVNSYFAVMSATKIKRKGDYARGGLQKNPRNEICSDAVAKYLADGTPIADTIRGCRDIRKFVTVRKVNGGAVKMHGHGPAKGALVKDMTATLVANGWAKDGHKWRKSGVVAVAEDAYASCFPQRVPEYLGKVVRWYYSTRCPGPIEYVSNGNTVGMSDGARPCMVLPDEFPDDVDYDWYILEALQILVDIGK